MTTRAKEIRELGNTGYLEVDANGNVGIGTANPNNVGGYRALHIDGTNGSLIDMGASGKESRIVADDNGLGFQVTPGTHTNQNIRWKAGQINGATDSHMLLDSSGNLYIGTTTVSNHKLNISSDQDTGIVINTVNTRSGSGTSTMLNLTNNTDTDIQFVINEVGAATKYASIGPSVSGRALMLGAPGGNVGIGTNVPGYGLDVHNTSRFTDILKVEEPIWSYSDIGTKYYTHLATGSLYQGTGAILIKTNIPGHDQPGNSNMFSIRLVGYNYNSKGSVDLWLGCYAGEGNFYSTACHGVCPSEWKDDIYVYTDTNGKVVFRIGTTSTSTFGEYAVAEFVQGFGSVNTSYSKGWTITSVSTLETESNTTQLSKVAFMPNSLTVQRGIFNEGNYSQLVSNPGVSPGYRRYQVLSCNNIFASNESGVWKDVAYVSYSPNLDIHGMTIENNSPSYGAGVFNGVIRGTYGAVDVHEITKTVAAQNGGHITNIEYRYLNGGAASGSYRLQVRLTFSSTSWSINVTTLLSGQAWNTISED